MPSWVYDSLAAYDGPLAYDGLDVYSWPAFAPVIRRLLTRYLSGVRPVIYGPKFPASPTLLEDALVRVITGYVSNLKLISPKPDETGAYTQTLAPAVLASSIPGFLTGFDDPSRPPNFPSIIVQMCDGEIHSDGAWCGVKILVGIFDPHLSKQGFRSVHNVITTITNGLWFDQVILGVYRLDQLHPYRWHLYEPEKGDLHPFYFGFIQCAFDVLKPQPAGEDLEYFGDQDPREGYGAVPQLPPGTPAGVSRPLTLNNR